MQPLMFSNLNITYVARQPSASISKHNYRKFRISMIYYIKYRHYLNHDCQLLHQFPHYALMWVFLWFEFPTRELPKKWIG